MEDKIKSIIRHYGVDHQLRKLQEEVFELSESIIIAEQYEINPDEDSEYITHIAEEIADVQVMIEQFKKWYEISEECITRNMEMKVNRQIGRISKEVQNVTR